MFRCGLPEYALLNEACSQTPLLSVITCSSGECRATTKWQACPRVVYAGVTEGVNVS